jgi:hypothetical protein
LSSIFLDYFIASCIPLFSPQHVVIIVELIEASMNKMSMRTRRAQGTHKGERGENWEERTWRED